MTGASHLAEPLEAALDDDPRVARLTSELAEARARIAELTRSPDYRALLDMVPDAAVVIDPETGRIVAVNAAMARMYGYERAEMIGLGTADYSAAPEATASALTRDRWVVDKRDHKRKDGTIFPIEGTGSRFVSDGRTLVFGIIRDITERLANKAALREVRSRLDLAMDQAHLAYWEMDAATNVFTFNDPFYLLCGTTAEREGGYRMAADTFAREFVPPEDMPVVAADMQRVLSGDKAEFETEYRVRRRDGELRHMLVHLTVARDTAGRVVRALGCSQDITQRKRAEESLRQSEERYRTLTTDLQIGVLIQGAQAEMLLCNPKALELLGLTEEQLMGRSSFDPSWNVIHEDGSPFPGPTHPVPQAIATGRPVRSVVMGVYRPTTNDRVWLLVDAHPALNADGSVRQVVCTFADMTERKHAEDALRDKDRALQWSETQLRMAEQIGQAGSWVYNLETGGIWGSAEGLRMFGYPAVAKEWPIEEIESCIPERERVHQALVDLLGEGRPYDLEYDIQPADGSQAKVVHSMARIERDSSGRPLRVVGFVQDVTARKRAERALAQLNAELEQRVATAVADLRDKDRLLIVQGRQAAMGEMIAHIAHQWRQPLNAFGLVLANVDDLYRLGELDAAAMDRAMEDSRRLIQKMSSTISVFAGFFKPDKNKRPFSALFQIQETLSMLEATKGQVQTLVEVATATRLTFFGSPNEYSQVLMNLFSNARQAIASAHVIPGRVTVRVDARDGFGCVSVRDNGGGIPAEVRDRIFDPYFSTKKGGTGIGLYMSRKIVEESFGGHLDARNVEGGAEFTVRVPLYTGEAESSPTA